MRRTWRFPQDQAAFDAYLAAKGRPRFALEMHYLHAPGEAPVPPRRYTAPWLDALLSHILSQPADSPRQGDV